VATFVAGSNHMAMFRVSIPNQPSLVGVHFFEQALVPDPGANAANAVLSDAAEGVVGFW
jgi:hypothetical protein